MTKLIGHYPYLLERGFHLAERTFGDTRLQRWFYRRVTQAHVPTSYQLSLRKLIPLEQVRAELEAVNRDGTIWKDEVLPAILRSWKLLHEGRSRGEPICNATMAGPVPEEALAVRDWLLSLNSEWIEKKLPKINWPQAVEHVRKWHDQLAKQDATAAGIDGTDSRIESVDGHYWVRLITEKALDREGRAMGNCVGRGAYDHYLEWSDDPRSGIFSLRDSEGDSITTAEINCGYVEQIERRANTPVVADDAPHIGILSRSLQIEDAVWRDLHMFRDVRTGHIYTLGLFPDGMTIDGDMQIEGFAGVLPAHFHVRGSLRLAAGYSPKTLPLPFGLTVDCDLKLPESYLPLPDDVIVHGQVIPIKDGEPVVRGLQDVDLDTVGTLRMTMTVRWVSPEVRELMFLGADTQRLRSRTSPVTPMMYEEHLPGELEQDERVRVQLSRLLSNRSRLTLRSGVVTNNVAPGEPVTVQEWADREFPPDDQPWVARAVAAMIERQQRQEAQRRLDPHWVAMNQNHRRRPGRRA